jgi:flagellar hook assembly protein FlgD
MPKAFALHQNVPNPFNPTTRIRFDLPEAAAVRLAVYNVNGQMIRILANGPMQAGARDVTWDGRDAAGRAAASGIYFYRLDAGRFTQTRKMILLR